MHRPNPFSVLASVFLVLGCSSESTPDSGVLGDAATLDDALDAHRADTLLDAAANDGGVDAASEAPRCGDANTFEFPAGSGLCIADPCAIDACPGGSCSNATGVAQCTPCTRFVDASIGDDANDGRSAARAWRSLAPLTTTTLVAGDNVCLRRGQTFEGSLELRASGTEGAPIRFSGNGVGARPIVTGMRALTAWSTSGPGVQQAACAGCSQVTMVTLDGLPIAMGRTPNADAPDEGYLTYERVIGPPTANGDGYYTEPYAGTLGLVDETLAASPSWSGAQLVIRKAYYVVERPRVLTHTGTTLTYENLAPAGGGFVGRPGWGYFIQDSRATLDRFGEWYFDRAASQLHLYMGERDPASLRVEVATSRSLLTIRNQDHIRIEGIALRGASENVVHIDTARGIALDDCEISQAGNAGIYTSNVDGLEVMRSTIRDANNTGMYLRLARNTRVLHNLVERSGVIPGAGGIRQADGDYTGIFVDGNGSAELDTLVEGNRVLESGYNGIHFNASGITVRRNLVQRFNILKDDGGGIYTWRPTGSTYVNRRIEENIVLDGLEARGGKPVGELLLSSCVYLDNATHNVVVTGNTLARCSRAGILHNYTTDVMTLGNTLFDNGGTQADLVSDRMLPMRNTTMRDNVFVATNESQWVVEVNAASGQLENLGDFNANFYVRPTPNDLFLHTTLDGTVGRTYSLPGWRETFGDDVDTRASTVVFGPRATTTGTNRFGNGRFDRDISGLFVWTATMNHMATFEPSGGIDAGALALRFTSPVRQDALVYGSVGAVDATRAYVLRVTTRGTQEGRIYGALRQTRAPYANLVPRQDRRFGRETMVHEFVFAAPTSDADASFLFGVLDSSGTTYIDNIEFFEATLLAEPSGPRFRFEYNATTLPRRVELDRAYVDARGVRQSGSVELAPFSSIVLLRDDAR